MACSCGRPWRPPGCTSAKPVWHAARRSLRAGAGQRCTRQERARAQDRRQRRDVAGLDLLAHGLIRASFVPPVAVQELRTLTRTRKQFVRERTAHTQRIDEGARGRQPQARRRAQRCPGQERPRGAAGDHRRSHGPRTSGTQCVTTRVKASRAELIEALRGHVSAAPPLHAQAAGLSFTSMRSVITRPSLPSKRRWATGLSRPFDKRATAAEHNAVASAPSALNVVIAARSAIDHDPLRHARSPAVLGLHRARRNDE